MDKASIDEWIARRHARCSAGALGSEASTCSPNTTATSRRSFFAPGSSRTTFSELEEASLAEDRRRVVRSELVQVAGSPHEAFRILDLSGSRRVSFQEFTDGLLRLDIQWQELTGLKKPRELFKLFDMEKRGVVSLEELFPETRPSQTEPSRMSTPDLWSRWIRGTHDVGQAREPCWEDGPGEHLQMLFDEAQARQEVSERRRWMSSTMRRLKHQGKSDARCRELCAGHLPRGTGPKDRDDVPTFSDLEVTNCRKDYGEQVSVPVRNIQKTVYDMREQRKVLQEAKQKLRTITRGQQQEATTKPKDSLKDLVSFGKNKGTAPPAELDD